MPVPVIVTVLSGFSVSSAFALDPGDRAWSLEVPSMSGNAIRFAFTSASGGGAFFGALHPLGNVDAVVQSSTVRPAYGIVEFAPTPWGRVQTGVVTTDTATFQLFPVNRWR